MRLLEVYLFELSKTDATELLLFGAEDRIPELTIDLNINPIKWHDSPRGKPFKVGVDFSANSHWPNMYTSSLKLPWVSRLEATPINS